MAEEDRNSVLAQRIRERMDVLGLNPYSAALRAGLGADFVRDILRGKVKRPSAERLGKLAEALETSIYHLNGRDEPPLLTVNPYGEEVAAVSAPALGTPESRDKQPVLLPIKYELMANAFRSATEVSRAPLGFEAATVPPAYQDRDNWYELLRDDSMDLLIAPNSLVHVVAWGEEERDALGHGDIVVITRRLVAEGDGMHVVERSLRMIVKRYPGLWFFEHYASREIWGGFSDDVFRYDPDEARRARSDARRAMEAEAVAEGWASLAEKEAARQSNLSEQRGSSNEELTKTLAILDAVPSPVTVDQFIEQHRKWKPQVVGKVIRALTPIDIRGAFGLAQGPIRDISRKRID